MQLLRTALSRLGPQFRTLWSRNSSGISWAVSYIVQLTLLLCHLPSLCNCRRRSTTVGSGGRPSGSGSVLAGLHSRPGQSNLSLASEFLQKMSNFCITSLAISDWLFQCWDPDNDVSVVIIACHNHVIVKLVRLFKHCQLVSFLTTHIFCATLWPLMACGPAFCAPCTPGPGI